MTLNAYQVSYNGLTMGDGTVYDITGLTGFDALPTINQNDVDRLRDWGQYAGSYFSTGREMVLSIEISDTSDAAFRADIDALNAAVVPQSQIELPFAVNLPGWAQVSRQSNVRVIDRTLALDYSYTRHYATCDITFWATDPRIYDSTSTTVTASQPSLTGGTPWPIVWPAPWGTIVTGTAAVNVVNAGTFETRPVLTLTGPISNPSITNTGTGQSLTFQGLVLGGSDTLVVDFRAHTAIVNGSSNARGTLTAASAWFLFPPGTTSLVLTGGATTSGTQLSCTYQSAWM